MDKKVAKQSSLRNSRKMKAKARSLKTIGRRLPAEVALPPALLFRFLRGRGARILMYHRVADLAGDRLSVKPTEFIRQMDFLRERGYRIIPLSELPSALTSSSSPAVSLTFDDGYRDFYDNAFPILKERRLPAAVFVITGLMEGKVRLPRYRKFPQSAKPLSWEMLPEMARAGIEIGSHSLTHRELTRLSRAEAEEEIEGSARLIREKTGGRPEWFSYPRGKFNREVIDLVKAAGYSGAVTVQPGANHSPGELFSLKRTEISRDDSLRDFALKLKGAYDPWHYLWQKIKGESL